MKKIKFYVAATFAALAMMMSSCMSDGANEESYMTYGIAKSQSLYGGPVLLKYSDIDANYPLYIPQLTAKLEGGEFYYVGGTINYDDENNSESNIAKNKYITATSYGYADVVKKNAYSALVEDKEKLLPNETKFSGLSFNQTTIEKYLLGVLSMTNVPEDSDISFHIDIDTENVKAQESQYYGKYNTYNAYLRVIINPTKETTTTKTVESHYALYLNSNSQFSDLQSKETNNDNYFFGLNINYVKSIDEDKETVTWDAVSGSVMVYTGGNN